MEKKKNNWKRRKQEHRGEGRGAHDEQISSETVTATVIGNGDNNGDDLVRIQGEGSGTVGAGQRHWNGGSSGRNGHWCYGKSGR